MNKRFEMGGDFVTSHQGNVFRRGDVDKDIY